MLARNWNVVFLNLGDSAIYKRMKLENWEDLVKQNL